MGNPAFHALLFSQDPVAAAQIHPSHTSRLVHAWEVLQATGKPISYFHALPKTPLDPAWRFRIIMIMPPRDVLYARCNARFDSMIQAGVEEELEAFDARVAHGEIADTAPSVKTLGAAPLRDYRLGLCSKDDAHARAKAQTRQYAKRQVTWFRHQIKPSEWILSIDYLEGV
jgi:tRNA dimethylallyltransferase